MQMLGMQAGVRPNRTKPSRNRTKMAETRHNLAEVVPKPADFGSTWGPSWVVSEPTRGRFGVGAASTVVRLGVDCESMRVDLGSTHPKMRGTTPSQSLPRRCFENGVTTAPGICRYGNRLNNRNMFDARGAGKMCDATNIDYLSKMVPLQNIRDPTNVVMHM